MGSLYASITPNFTKDLHKPGLNVEYTDNGGLWELIGPSLSLYLPLHHIEWKNSFGLIQIIETLPIEFLPMTNTIKPNPFVSIFLVKCEDIETYKTIIKKQLREWIEKMKEKKIEWMIWYVPLGTQVNARDIRLGAVNIIYKRIFERMKSDFGTQRPTSSSPLPIKLLPIDRICKIDILQTQAHSLQIQSPWEELLMKLQLCLMEAFERKCYLYEQDVKLLDTKRQTIGWKFSDFFLVKEKIALLHQDMNLLDDTIRHFDELEATYLTLQEHEKMSFLLQKGSSEDLQAHDPCFHVSPLAIELNAIPEELGASKCVSENKLKLHFFIRQIRTLAIKGDLALLLQRSRTFILMYVENLRELSNLDWIYAYQWGIGACLEIAFACEEVTASKPPPLSTEEMQANEGEEQQIAEHLANLLYVARQFILSFKKRARNGSSVQISDSVSVNTASDIWYTSIVESLCKSLKQSDESLELLEWEVSHLAGVHYSRAGRFRLASFLNSKCGEYHLRHHQYVAASRILRSSIKMYEESNWEDLAVACMKKLLQCERAKIYETQQTGEMESDNKMETNILTKVSASLTNTIINTTPVLEKKYLRVFLQDLEPTNDSHTPVEEATSSIEIGPYFNPILRVKQHTAHELVVTIELENPFPFGVHLKDFHMSFNSKWAPISHVDSGSIYLNAINSGTEAMKALPVILTFHVQLSEANMPTTKENTVFECTELSCVIADTRASLLIQRDGNPLQISSVYLLPSSYNNPALSDPEAVPVLHTYCPPFISPTLENNTSNTIINYFVVEVDLSNKAAHGVGTLESTLRVTSQVESKLFEISFSHVDIVNEVSKIDQVVSETHMNTDKLSPNGSNLIISSVALENEKTFIIVWFYATSHDRIDTVCNTFTIHTHLSSLHTSNNSEEDSLQDTRPSFVLEQENQIPIANPFQVLKISKQKSDNRLYLCIPLQCSKSSALNCLDYKLKWSKTEESMNNLEDPNKHICGRTFYPQDIVYFAFILNLTNEKELSDAVFSIDIELRQDIQNQVLRWSYTQIYPISLAEMNQPTYEISVQLLDTFQWIDESMDTIKQDILDISNLDLVFTKEEEITFKICIQQKSPKHSHPQDPPEQLFLCFDTESQSDWTLLGDIEEEIQMISDMNGNQTFETLKTFYCTRTGFVNVPHFKLRLSSTGEYINDALIYFTHGANCLKIQEIE